MRDAGQHVGEMALLDPGQPRSATVTAVGEVSLARTPAAAFIDLANCYLVLWRNVARSLANRLRQRSGFVTSRRTAPVLFVGCSVESLRIGEAIKARLNQTDIEVNLRTDDVFRPSTFTLESLEAQLACSDFAAVVLAPDDEVTSRDNTTLEPHGRRGLRTRAFHGRSGARTGIPDKAARCGSEGAERPCGLYPADLRPNARY